MPSPEPEGQAGTRVTAKAVVVVGAGGGCAGRSGPVGACAGVLPPCPRCLADGGAQQVVVGQRIKNSLDEGMRGSPWKLRALPREGEAVGGRAGCPAGLMPFLSLEP